MTNFIQFCFLEIAPEAAVIETVLIMVKNLEDDAEAQIPKLSFLCSSSSGTYSDSDDDNENDESESDKIPCEFCNK